MLFIKTLQTKIIYLKSLETISYSKCVIKRSHKHNKLTVVLTKIRRKHDRSQRVGDSRWWEFLTVAPAGNKAKRISSANHTTKAIHHHHLQLPPKKRLSYGCDKCLSECFIYEASVTNKYYYGTCENTFKERYSCSFRNKSHEKNTELTKYGWELIEKD